ncbi:hypothetical protein GCM10027589_06980 [Actinocorallia lasiicapitis]
MVLAATATAALIVVPSILLSTSDRTPTRPLNTPDKTLTAEGIVERAQRIAATKTAFTAPDGDRFLYVESVRYQNDTPDTHMGSAPLKYREPTRAWTSLDRRHGDAVQQGKGPLRWRCLPPDADMTLQEPLVTNPDKLPAGCHIPELRQGPPTQELPIELDRLETWLADESSAPPGSDAYFGQLSSAYSSARVVLPPWSRAGLFAVFARYPGAKVIEGVRDRMKRPAVAIESPGVEDEKHQLLFDPETFALLGSRTVFATDRWGPVGHVHYEGVIVAQKVVDRIGERSE